MLREIKRVEKEKRENMKGKKNEQRRYYDDIFIHYSDCKAEFNLECNEQFPSCFDVKNEEKETVPTDSLSFAQVICGARGPIILENSSQKSLLFNFKEDVNDKLKLRENKNKEQQKKLCRKMKKRLTVFSSGLITNKV